MLREQASNTTCSFVDEYASETCQREKFKLWSSIDRHLQTFPPFLNCNANLKKMYSLFKHQKELVEAKAREEHARVLLRNSSPKKSNYGVITPIIYQTQKQQQQINCHSVASTTNVEQPYRNDQAMNSPTSKPIIRGGVFKQPSPPSVTDSQSSMLKKYRDVQKKSKFSNNHESITNDMLHAADTVGRVIEQCDPDDEKYNIRLLLEELNRLDILKKKRRSLVPMKPISYTKRESKSPSSPPRRSSSCYWDKENETSASCLNTSFQSTAAASMRRPGSAPSCRMGGGATSVASVPVSVSRTVISSNSQYLANVIPSRCIDSFVASRPSRPSSAKRPSSATHVKYLKEGKVPPHDLMECEEEKTFKEQQLNDLLYNLVCEYHYLKDRGKEETEKEKKEYIALKVSFQRVYPLIKKHFQTYFASRKEFTWRDQQVIQLNKDIEEIALEEQIRDRVEQEHMDFLTKKLKVNQIRKAFKAQRQQNFLKRVVVSDPRALSQLQQLCNDDKLDDALNEEIEEWENAELYDPLDYERPSVDIPKIDLTKTKKKQFADNVSVGGYSTGSRISTNDRNAHMKFLRLMTPEASSGLRNTPDMLTPTPTISRANSARLSSGRRFSFQKKAPVLDELDKRCDKIVVTEKSGGNPLDEIDNFEKRLNNTRKKDLMW